MDNVRFEMSNSVKKQWQKLSMKDVTILDVTDPIHFWVREAKSVKMGHEAQAFYDFEEEMNAYNEDYFVSENYIPRKGVVCCVKWNNHWYRGLVILKIDSPSRGYLIKCFLVDWYEIVTISEMRISDNWDESALTFVKKSVTAHTRAKLKVLSYGTDSIEVDLVLFSKQGRMNLKNVLLSKHFAVSTESNCRSSENHDAGTDLNFSDCDEDKIKNIKVLKETIKNNPQCDINHSLVTVSSSDINNMQGIFEFSNINGSEKKVPKHTSPKTMIDKYKEFYERSKNSRSVEKQRNVSSSLQSHPNESKMTTNLPASPCDKFKNISEDVGNTKLENKISFSSDSNVCSEKLKTFNKLSIPPIESPSNSANSSVFNDPSVFHSSSPKQYLRIAEKVYSTDQRISEKSSESDSSGKIKVEEKLSISSDSHSNKRNTEQKSSNRSSICSISSSGESTISSAFNDPSSFLSSSPKLSNVEVSKNANSSEKITDKSSILVDVKKNTKKLKKCVPHNHDVILKFYAQHGPTSRIKSPKKSAPIHSAIKSVIHDGNTRNKSENSYESKYAMSYSSNKAESTTSACSDQSEDSISIKTTSTGALDKSSSSLESLPSAIQSKYRRSLSMRRAQNCMVNRVESEGTWNAATFETEMASSFKNLDEHISGNIIAVGERIPPPFLRIENKFDESIISSYSFKSPSVIQRHAWSAIYRGRNVVAVPLPSNGNILVYLVPIISELIDGTNYESIPNGMGPFALVLCATSESAVHIHEVACQLIRKSKVPCKLLYPGNEATSKPNLINGCDLLIATPGSLLRVMEETDRKILNISRLCHLILNDADILTENYTEEITLIMKEYTKVIVKPVRNLIPYQIIAIGSTWNKALSEFVDGYFVDSLEKSFKRPILYFTSIYEAAIYAKVHTLVSFVSPYYLLNKLINIFDECNGKKTVVFVSKNVDAVNIFNMTKAYSKNVLRADNKMNISELKGKFPLLFFIHYFAQIGLKEKNFVYKYVHLSAVGKQWKNSYDKKMAPILICTDSCLFDLGISDAKCIVHFDIPQKSRTSFGLRYNAMRDWLTVEDSMDQDCRCISFMLVTKECIVQSSKLLSFIKRIKAEVPKQLIELANLRKKEIEDLKISSPICCFVKACGQCNYEKLFKIQCGYRHTLIYDLDKPTKSIPESGIITIFITRVVTAVHYYANIFHHEQHDPNKDLMPSIREKYSKMLIDLNAHYEIPANHLKPEPNSVNEENLYALCLEKTRYIRVKVTKVYSELQKQKNSTKVELLMVDDGKEYQCDVKELLELPTSFKALPPQAVEIFICNVIPIDREIKWSSEINAHMEEKLLETELKGQIRLRIGNTVWLDPLVRQERLDEIDIVINSFRVDKYLIEHGWAVKNEQHLQKLMKTCNAVGIPVLSIPEITTKDSTRIDDQPKIFSYAHLDKDAYSAVQVSVIHFPHLFYVQHSTFTECLTELINEMKQWAESKKKRFLMNVEIGALCLAYFEDEETWGRAKVLDVTDGGAKVMYLDFGDEREVSKNNLLRLLDKFCKLPFQAIECSLADVCFSDDCESWTDEHIDAFESLTRVEGTDEMLPMNLKGSAQDLVSAGYLHTWVVVFEKETRENKGHFYRVFLLSTNMFLKSNSIGQHLVAMGFANPQNQAIVMKVCSEFDNRFNPLESSNPCELVHLQNPFWSSKFLTEDLFQTASLIHGKNNELTAHSGNDCDDIFLDDEDLEEVKILNEMARHKESLKKSYAYDSNNVNDSAKNIDNEHLVKVKLTPDVKWAQNNREIFLSVKLTGVEEYELNLQDNSIFFSTSTAVTNVATSQLLNISFCNIHGLSTKLNSIHHHLQSKNPHILILTEPKIKPLDFDNNDALPAHLKSPVYELFSSFYPNGGVCTLNDVLYTFDLKLYGTIKVSTESGNEYKVKVKSREINITLFKLNPISEWPRLQEDVAKSAFLGIDFDKNDIDSDDEDTNFQLIDDLRYKKFYEEKQYLYDAESECESSDSDSFDLNS
ncbi:putative ATP-dependent RNA helicase TDRD12 [Nymphon striatum]|nr:putative ATP-dependent RNA helicase TDRD12 [Nymphon striatum]